jgi:hypothetical protein
MAMKVSTKIMRVSTLVWVTALLAVAKVWAAAPDPALVELSKLAFFHGREYFALRSGRAQMIIQADRADLGPAFTYLLFDAETARQSVNKEGAFNFIRGEGFTSSALEVVLGGFPFTALGHRTETRWVWADGVPAVEAVWWAGGVRVTERIAALGEGGVFRRSIQLEGAHLVDREAVTLRLALPAGERRQDGPVLLQAGRGARLALAVLGGSRARVQAEKGMVEVGPLTVSPTTSRVSVETLLVIQLPAGDEKPFAERVNALQTTGAKTELAQAQARWAAASSLATQDRLVQEIFDKARFGLPGMVADDGTMNAGIFEYGAQWVRDTANTLLGALHAGHFELVRAGLVRILTQMISQEGVTMIAGGFDSPDREQFDQMGELLHLLRSYRDWTGDDSLVRQHRALLLALIERPLQPQFRDDTGMVHNRREFWERTFDDAYELAYQTYVILGLWEAAELAPALGAEDRAERWHQEADRIRRAMLTHPSRSLVDANRLIKRRNVTGEIADRLRDYKGFLPDVPGNTEQHHRLLPDASQALPIALGVVDPRSDLAHVTLNDLEALWNTRWSDGGYDRYHTSSQPDQPGPWTFATCFILRAQHDAGLWERSRRSLEWLNTVPGGRAGAWFEEIPSNRSQQKSCGVIPWTSGEIALFIVRHYLGVRFEHGAVVLRPGLYPGSPPLSADLRFRKGRLKIEVNRSGAFKLARVNGQTLTAAPDGSLRLPQEFESGTVVIEGTAGR